MFKKIYQICFWGSYSKDRENSKRYEIKYLIRNKLYINECKILYFTTIIIRSNFSQYILYYANYVSFYSCTQFIQLLITDLKARTLKSETGSNWRSTTFHAVWLWENWCLPSKPFHFANEINNSAILSTGLIQSI